MIWTMLSQIITNFKPSYNIFVVSGSGRYCLGQDLALLMKNRSANYHGDFTSSPSKQIHPSCNAGLYHDSFYPPLRRDWPSMVFWLPKDWFSLFWRVISSVISPFYNVLSISVIQCIHFKMQLNVCSFWDGDCFMKNMLRFCIA